MQRQISHCVKLSGRILLSEVRSQSVIWGLILNTGGKLLLGPLQKHVNISGVNIKIWIVPKLLNIQIVIKVQKPPEV